MNKIPSIPELMRGKIPPHCSNEQYVSLFNEAKAERQRLLEALGPKTKIRYDIIGANRSGVPLHPQEAVEGLGMHIFTYEGMSIADCVDMEVYGVPESLPEYIDILKIG